MEIKNEMDVNQNLPADVSVEELLQKKNQRIKLLEDENMRCHDIMNEQKVNIYTLAIVILINILVFSCYTYINTYINKLKRDFLYLRVFFI